MERRLGDAGGTGSTRRRGVEPAARGRRPGRAPAARCGVAGRCSLGSCVTTPNSRSSLLSALLHAWWSASIKGSRNPLAFNLLQLVAAASPPRCLSAVLGSARRRPPRVWWIAIGTGRLARPLLLLDGARVRERRALGRLPDRALGARLPAALRGAAARRDVISLAARSASRWWWPACGRCRRDAGVVAMAALRARPARGSPGSRCAPASATRSATRRRWRGSAPRPGEPAVPPRRRLLRAARRSRAALRVRAARAAPRVARGAARALARSRVARACFAAVVSFVGYALILQALRTAPVSLRGRGAPDQRALRGRDRRAVPARAAEPAAPARRARDRRGRRAGRELRATVATHGRTGTAHAQAAHALVPLLGVARWRSRRSVPAAARFDVAHRDATARTRATPRSHSSP